VSLLSPSDRELSYDVVYLATENVGVWPWQDTASSEAGPDDHDAATAADHHDGHGLGTQTRPRRAVEMVLSVTLDNGATFVRVPFVLETPTKSPLALYQLQQMPLCAYAPSSLGGSAGDIKRSTKGDRQQQRQPQRQQQWPGGGFRFQADLRRQLVPAQGAGAVGAAAFSVRSVAFNSHHDYFVVLASGRLFCRLASSDGGDSTSSGGGSAGAAVVGGGGGRGGGGGVASAGAGDGLSVGVAGAGAGGRMLAELPFRVHPQGPPARVLLFSASTTHAAAIVAVNHRGGGNLGRTTSGDPGSSSRSSSIVGGSTSAHRAQGIEEDDDADRSGGTRGGRRQRARRSLHLVCFARRGQFDDGQLGYRYQVSPPPGEERLPHDFPFYHAVHSTGTTTDSMRGEVYAVQCGPRWVGSFILVKRWHHRWHKRHHLAAWLSCPTRLVCTPGVGGA
jgi:hypothetical protein